MKQIILENQGKIAIRDVPIPEPSRGEVVIKINTALTCGTDLKAYLRGHKLIPMPGPFGHEYSGTAAMVGEGVKGFREGDNVMGVHSAPCLMCRYCRKGLYNLCAVIMENKALGAFSEFMLLPAHVVEQNLFHKPDDLSFEQAALLEPFSCVVHPYGKLKLDNIETALVIGAGPIGLMHFAFLNMKGVRVIVSDLSENRLSAASKMGAMEVALSKDLEDRLSNATDNLGADLVIDCTGQSGVWEKAIHYTRRGGTVVLFGGCPEGESVTYDTHRLHYDELSILGSFHFTPQDVRNAYHVIIEKNVDLYSLISGEFPLEEIEKAFTLLREGKGIKYALKP